MVNAKSIKPPSIPQKLFRWYCDPRLQESILGDMEEQFDQDVVDYGAWKAKRRFCWNVLRFFRKGIIKPVSGGKLNYYGMFRHNLKIGWRNILRKKSSSIINIIGLSTGSAVCLLTLIFYRYETSFDHHHRLADQTYRIVQKTKLPEADLHWGTTAYPLANALRSDFPDFEYVTQTAGPVNRQFSYQRPNGRNVLFEEQFVLFADKFYPQVFDFEWLAGDPQTALSELDAVIITTQVAEKCFGQYADPSDAIGQVLMLNNKDPLVVKGVIKNNRANINLKANMIVSYEFFKKHNPYPTGNWSGNYQGTSFVVLNDARQQVDIKSKINEWKGKYLEKVDDERISYALQPLEEIHTETKYGSTPQGYQISKQTLNVSLLVSVFILLITIINFINLITANASIRSKEVGIRKVIGGGKKIIFGQFIIENTLLVSIAFFIGTLLTFAILDVINDSLSMIKLDLRIRAEELVTALGFCLLVASLATIYPSVILSSFSPIKALQGKGYLGSKGGGFRKGLTFFQFTIVQVFVIAAIIVGLQLRYFDSKSLGFSPEKIVSIEIPSFHKKDVLTHQLMQLPGVSQVSVGSGPPMAVDDFALGTRFRESHQPENEGMSAEMKIIDSAYLKLYDIPLIAGRNVQQNKPMFDEFIVNRTLASAMSWTPEQALGKRLAINEGEATIVGVVEDFHNHSLQNEITPVVMMNWQGWQWQGFLRVDSFASMVAVEEAWRAQFPGKVFSYQFLNDSIEKEYVIEGLIFTGFEVLSALVIIIAALGLFGLISFLTLQKTKEIGIRKVLGASIAEVVLLFNRQFSLLILLAFLTSIPIVWYFMEQWLSAFDYRIPISVWMFLVGGLITFALGSSVAMLKSYKAALVNPAEILKDE